MPQTRNSSALLDLLAELIESDADRAQDGRRAALHRWKAKALESADALIPMHATLEKVANARPVPNPVDAVLGQMIEMRRNEVERWFLQTFGLPAKGADRERRN
jgi:hypothetical protein